MTPYATFDLEIADEIPGGIWDKKTKLGVTCAAIMINDKKPSTVMLEYQPGRMEPDKLRYLGETLLNISAKMPIITWNGAAFDFHVLAVEMPEYIDSWRAIANSSIDLMLQIVFQRSHFLGLDKALKGAGLAGKTHNVRLKTGEIITDMGGARAPQLWAAEEYDAVLTYLRGDVVTLATLVEWVNEHKYITWTSGSGKDQIVPMAQMRTVGELRKDRQPPAPNWNKTPASVRELTAWLSA